MPGELHTVFLAEFVNLFCIALAEKVAHKPPEFVARVAVIADGQEKLIEVLQNIFAPAVFVLLGERQTPGDTVAGNLRLVGENAGHIAAVAVGIGLVRHADKLLRHLFVERVDVKSVYIVVKMLAVKIADCAIGVRLAVLHTQIFLPVCLAETVDLAAAEAARPAVFVIRPRAHTALFCLFNADIGVDEPFVAHILGLKPAARVHKISADADFIHHTNLPCRFLLGKPLVPGPERYRSVFFFGIFNIHHIPPRDKFYVQILP